MKSICFFASYFRDSSLPYYITVYLKELKKYFSEVVLLTSQKNLSEPDIQFLNAENIQLNIKENQGFDFGLWYKAFQEVDVNIYDQVALVNDSCILFKSLGDFFNWSKTNNADLQGITQSEAIAPHIQSYFLVINKNAIVSTKKYFDKQKVFENISDVILNYEVGLSSFLISEGFKISSFIDNNNYKGKFSPYYYCVDYHLSVGIPVIKKKIIFGSYRKGELFTLARMNFNINADYYINQIKQKNKEFIIDFERLRIHSENSISTTQKIKYNLNRKLISLFKPVYKKIKHV